MKNNIGAVFIDTYEDRNFLKLAVDRVSAWNGK